MFSFRTTPLFDQPDRLLRDGRIAVLCNQAAWHPERCEYLFETLCRSHNLVRVLMPEHSLYGDLGNGIESVEVGRTVNPDCLRDVDVLVIELQDIGSRYSYFTSLLYNLFQMLKDGSSQISVYILDRNNPSGRQIEGTMGDYGLPQRHGLTYGEVANMFYSEMNAKFPLHIISASAESVNKELLAWSIPPFSDFAGMFTSTFYSGQCLWKGTNVSYGHGTTKPFEQFGAPYMERLLSFNEEHHYRGWNDTESPMYDDAVYFRWTRFVPAYGLYEGQVCFGFQLIPVPGKTYHALNHALRILRFVHDTCPEFRCDNLASLLLDEALFQYVNGFSDWDVTREYIKGEEQKWLRKSKKFALYDELPWRVK